MSTHLPPDEETKPAPSPRELELVRLLAEGKSSKEVAQDLGLSTNTVDTHRRNLIRKFNCNNMIEVVAMFIRDGLV
jgi:DNA-binding NarL/FixJ family response regulator